MDGATKNCGRGRAGSGVGNLQLNASRDSHARNSLFRFHPQRRPPRCRKPRPLPAARCPLPAARFPPTISKRPRSRICRASSNPDSSVLELPREHSPGTTPAPAMYHLAKGIYRYATSKEEYSVILLGLDNAGKTTFHEQVKSMFIPNAPEPKLKTVPTVGQNVSTIPLADMYLKLWDVGGQHSLRNLWQSYYASCHAIVFIIDSTDIGDGNLEDGDNDDRLEECRLVLEDVLQHSETEGVPLLILANKQDREDCVETIRIKEGLVKKVMEGDKALSIRDSRVLSMSALTGEGVKEAIDWVRTRVQWNKESRPPVMR